MERKNEVIEEEITFVNVSLPQQSLNDCVNDKKDDGSFQSKPPPNETTIKSPNEIKSSTVTPKDDPLRVKDSMFKESFGAFFYKIAGPDELIDSFELQNVLKMIFKENGNHIGLETSRCILASADTNRDGRLSYSEFKNLWFKVIKWKKCFEKSDLNKDKMINKVELDLAFKELGIHRINSTTTDAIFSRYGNKQNLISMDDFIQILCKLDSATQWAKEFDKNMTLDAFMKELLYC